MHRRPAAAFMGLVCAAGCASAPEPFSADRRVAYLAVESESLSRFYDWLKARPGAPATYESVDFKFRNACGERARIRLRFGARSELGRAALTPREPGWSFTAADLIAPGVEDPGPLEFYETTLSGYAPFALTSAGGRYIDFPTDPPRVGFDFGDAQAVYVGAYRVAFDPDTGAASLTPVADGPTLDALAQRPLTPISALCL